MMSELENLTTPMEASAYTSQQTSEDDDNDMNDVIDSINNLSTTVNENVENDDSESLSSTESENNFEENVSGDNVDKNYTTSSVHHKYATSDILLLGTEEMKKENFIQTRLKKKQRINRNVKFINELFTTVENSQSKNNNDLSWMKDSISEGSNESSSPSFSSRFRSLKKMNKI